MSEATPIGSGRYGLLGTLSTTLPRIVRHRGVDTILDRDVTILVLTDATLHRDNVLESASRAVLVEDQRLQQVYDVERAEPSVIVTEPLTGRTFSSLVSRGMPRRRPAPSSVRPRRRSTPVLAGDCTTSTCRRSPSGFFPTER